MTIAVLMLAASCASDGNQAGTESRLLKDGLPLAAVVNLASDDLASLTAAENLVLSDCMKQRGFDSIETPVAFGDPAFFDFRQRYYVRTPEEARALGYRPLNVEEIIESLTTEQVDSGASRSQEYYDALFGDTVENDGALLPDGSGCSSIAAVTIYGTQDRFAGFDGWTELMQIGADSYNETISSPEVLAAEDAWKDCMDERGYNFASPQAAINALATDSDQYVLPLSGDERDTAVADVECRDQVDLDQTYFEVESAVQLRRLDERPELADQVSDQISAAVDAATTVVDEDR